MFSPDCLYTAGSAELSLDKAHAHSLGEKCVFCLFDPLDAFQMPTFYLRNASDLLNNS